MAEITSHSQVKMGSERNFGIVFAIVFLIVASWPLLSGNPLRLWSLVIAAVFLGFTIFYPKALAPLNRIWFKFGELLGRIVSPLVMVLLFIITILPIALLMRLLGKDFLHLQLDKSARTYWIQRDEQNNPMGSMKNQF